MTTREICRAALAHANVQAFLRVIRAGESNQTEDAYRLLVGGSHFDGFRDHPRIAVKTKWGWSSAAGAYQAMCAVPGQVKTDTWGDFIRATEPSDFAPESQDIFAVWCVRRRSALDDVIAGRLQAAIAKCNREWASFPGSPYGQPVRTLEQLTAIYLQYGGQIDSAAPPEPKPEPEPKKERTVAPIIAALLPSLLEAIPKLGALFAKTPNAERNVKAAEVAFAVAKDALGAGNEQEVVERIKADPEALTTVAKAIEENWFGISQEVGGGIPAAREADSKANPGNDLWHSPAFLVSLLMLPLVYGTVYIVLTGKFSGEVQSMVVAAVVSGVLGSVTGFFLGSSFTAQRKDQLK